MSDDRPATSRRRFLALCAGAAGSFVPGVARAAAPRIDVLETKVLSLDAQHYHGCSRCAGALLHPPRPVPGAGHS